MATGERLYESQCFWLILKPIMSKFDLLDHGFVQFNQFV